MSTTIREPHVIYLELCNKIEEMLQSPPTPEAVAYIDNVSKEMYESLMTLTGKELPAAICYDKDTNEVLGFAALCDLKDGDKIMIVSIPDTELMPFMWNPKYPGMLGIAPQKMVNDIMEGLVIANEKYEDKNPMTARN